MTLADSAVIAFVATTDPERAIAFYRDRLGLKLVDESPFALEFEVRGTMLRIQVVDSLKPQPFTTLGWRVADIGASISALTVAGIVPERFPGVEQDEMGVWTARSGAKVAWFKDPDGNILSLTEFPL
jgi:catechol 2,3-dioxygenase-like lactoylglutathione lyase family enzyme